MGQYGSNPHQLHRKVSWYAWKPLEDRRFQNGSRKFIWQLQISLNSLFFIGASWFLRWFFSDAWVFMRTRFGFSWDGLFGLLRWWLICRGFSIFHHCQCQRFWDFFQLIKLFIFRSQFWPFKDIFWHLKSFLELLCTYFAWNSRLQNSKRKWNWWVQILQHSQSSVRPFRNPFYTNKCPPYCGKRWGIGDWFKSSFRTFWWPNLGIPRKCRAGQGYSRRDRIQDWLRKTFYSVRLLCRPLSEIHKIYPVATWLCSILGFTRLISGNKIWSSRFI